MMRDAVISQVTIDAAADAERRRRFPAGAAIVFADLEEHGRVGVLDRLRETEPVSWVPALGGWLVTAYELGREVLGRQAGFTVAAEQNLVRESLGAMMLTTDPPAHERQRCPFDEPFRVRPVRERFEQPVRRRVDDLIAALAGRGACELVTDLAAPFAIGVAGDVLGLSLDDVPRIQGFYEAFAGAMVYGGDTAPQRRADAARAELDAILHAEVRRVRVAPDASVTSAVANDPAAALDDDEIVAQLRVILFGAIETVESMVVNGVLMLLRHPDQLATVRAEPALIANAVEEAMRIVPPVAFIERWTTGETTLGAVTLGRGEFVGVSTIAAGRDPTVFPDPERFDVRRPNARHHLAFGFGAHHCLGFNLARMQGAIAVQAVLDGLPGLALVEPVEPRGFAFRRPPELRLRWQAGAS
jgi:cytochrome P450